VSSVLLGLSVLAARAEDRAWSGPTRPAVNTCPVVLGRPVPLVSLGRPVPLPSTDRPANPTPTVAPVVYQTDGPAWSWTPVIRAQAPDHALSLYGPPPVPPPTPDSGFPVPPAPPPPPPPGLERSLNDGVAVDRQLHPGVWDKCCDFWGKLTHTNTGCGRGLFQSDESFATCGPSWASPVSDPFNFIDPLSLTELRPIFIYQAIPSKNLVLGGGSAEFYGMQGSLALCESLSLVINKLGFVSLQPRAGFPMFNKDTGFAEFWLGPKWTFFRAPNTGTAIAAGLTFQLPIGDAKVFQNTGTLTPDPYISFAQNVRTGSYGSLNILSTTGFAVATDNQRSDYFHSHLHFDFDVINAHKFYPLIEFNWYQYTRSGKVLPVNFEGADLFNFGSTMINGKGLVTMAGGFRYKVCEHFQLGAAIEFPLTSYQGIEDYRVTADLIFRY
jgi:hypothetical protein